LVRALCLFSYEDVMKGHTFEEQNAGVAGSKPVWDTPSS